MKQHRDDSKGRVRGWQLQKLRRKLLSKQPLCVHCHAAGRVALAKELDHIVPLFKGGTNDESNLQGLCVECHRKKTAADLGVTYHPEIGFDGWPV